MNVLWVTNVPIPEVNLLMNEEPNPFGGWLVNASSALSEQEEIKLTIAFPKEKIDDVKVLQGSRIRFYAFPPVNEKEVVENKYNVHFDKILKEVKPDIVHIFGTEYPQSLDMVNVCKSKNINAVISIQGLVSICAKHYMACIPKKIENRITLRDFIKQDNLKQQQKKFEKKGKLEIAAIKKIEHVIGRTTWDNACTKQINSNVNYHFCNEILREEFYKNTWDINSCEEFSIFVSQGSYPIKGLHYVLEAMPLILERFPNAKLYISGNDITKSVTLKDKLKLSSYGKYIKQLIHKNDLQDKVRFTGLLYEREMCERYLKSNVFVCPSSIENSPNSLGEAMILGVPCVASHVGGVADLLRHKEEGFVYQADAPYMLAYYICEIFKNNNVTLDISKNARKHALETHDRENNTNRMVEIYTDIIK